MSCFLPFALPDIGEEEINEVLDSLRSGDPGLPHGGELRACLVVDFA